MPTTKTQPGKHTAAPAKKVSKLADRARAGAKTQPAARAPGAGDTDVAQSQRPRLQAVPPPRERIDPAAGPAHREAMSEAGATVGPGGSATTAHAASAAERLVGRFLEAADLSSDVRPHPAEFVDLAVNMLRAAALSAGIPADEVERQVAEGLAYLRRRLTGDVEVDEFGFDEDYTRHVHLPLLRPLYRKWFRVEVRGIENIPAVGGALVVANHSGTVALDSLMTQVAVHDEHPQHRHLRMLGADLVFQTPFIGAMARRSGSTLAANTDAERLFDKGELVGVWPEGFKGVGKPFSERYKLQRFGRGGFVAAALRAGVPIVPCSIVGAEEIYPILGNMPTVARLLGMPYAPITPTFPWLGPLGLIPLPSKWLIEFGSPIDTSGLGSEAAEDPMVVFDLTDQVRETIQQTLYSLLMQRSSVFI
jgi:1-acyl-sn-glycerol-3-phosphate acyltransferase